MELYMWCSIHRSHTGAHSLYSIYIGRQTPRCLYIAIRYWYFGILLSYCMWVYRNGFVATTGTCYSMSWRINQSFLGFLGVFFCFFRGGCFVCLVLCCLVVVVQTKKLYFLYYICLKYLFPTSLQIAIEHFRIFILLWHGILIFGSFAAYQYAKQLWKQWAHYWQGRSLLQPIIFRQFGTLLYVRQYEGLTSI